LRFFWYLADTFLKSVPDIYISPTRNHRQYFQGAMSKTIFGEKVKAYLKAAGLSQKILANTLGYSPTTLTHKLNGTGRLLLTRPDIRDIIKALAKIEAITYCSEALTLLAEADCPNFSVEEWKTGPLNKLEQASDPTFKQVSANRKNLAHGPTVPVSNNPAAKSSTPIPSNQANSTSTSRQLQEGSTLFNPKNEYSHNLPQPISSFIGRKQDLEKLRELLLEEKRRLVTLVGMGGIGKTRLALASSWELGDNFAGGIWLVELAPLNNPALIPQTIAEALGLMEQPGQTIMETLSHFLGQRHLLLILDNCEHLVEECSRITNLLLTHSTKLQILSTSREPLNITGEVTYRVPSLSLPPTKLPTVQEENLPTLTTIEKVEEYEAVKLFVERARATNSNFLVEPQEVTGLIQICQRLDGIPLALELAAARTTILSLGQIESFLNARFNLLTEGSRTSLPRHQTLRALIDWSYNLLSEAEKKTLDRASVFVASWDLEAATQVCGNSGELAEFEVLDCLNKLANKSLLLTDQPTEGQSARYHMLETIRQYGLEKLREEPGAEKAVRQRHFDYYIDLLIEIGPELFEGEQLFVMKQLDQEMDNIRPALEYGIKEKQTEQILRSIKGLGPYWEIRGLHNEGRQTLAQVLVLPHARDKKNEWGLGWTLWWTANLVSRLGNLEETKSYINQALAVSEAYGEDLELYLLCLENQATIQFIEGNNAEGQRILDKTILLAQGLSNAYKAANWSNRGYIKIVLGEFDEAQSWLEKALPLIRKEKNLHILINTLIGLGRVALSSEDYANAQSYLEEALSISHKLGHRTGISQSLAYLGQTYTLQNKFLQAQQVLQESLNLFIKVGGKIEIWDGYYLLISLLRRVWLKTGQSALLEQISCLYGTISEVYSKDEDWGNDKSEYEEGMEIARTGLGETEFEAAFARGQKLSQEEKILYCQLVLKMDF
jgi:non-specific serine/threonine protein kinase